MRAFALSATKAGMTRLLDKGGASKDSLYLLRNGHINASQRATQRPGTVTETTTLAGTKGLCAFRGGFVVFAHAFVAMADARYTCAITPHPTDPTQAVAEVHFAEPFMGYLYAVIEFANGDAFHYYLQANDAWSADTDYKLGDVVEPSVANGYAYRASRIGATPPVWAPDVIRAVGDVVIPTTENGFDYTVTDVVGGDPKSGATEPAWPESDGATVYEDTNLGTPSGSDSDNDGGQTLPPDTVDRYRPPRWWKFGDDGL